MAQLTREITIGESTVTEYAYREAMPKKSTLMGVVWDTSDSRDKECIAFKGATNERQLLAIPDNCKDPMYLALQSTIIGTDSEGNNILEYSVVADDASYNDAKMEEIRSERDRKLIDCDYTQLSDAPLNASSKAEWATYRQALRDLPVSVTDVDDVNWPVEPS